MRRVAFWSCFTTQILLLATLVPPARAVVVSEHSEMFFGILENLRTNYWSEDGDWLGDMQFDAASFAPQILYRYGSEAGDMDLIEKANRTVDRNIDLLMEVMGGDTTNLTEALIGATPILDAMRYYTGDKYADLPMKALAWLALREGKKIIIEDPNPLGDYIGYLFPFAAHAYASFYYASIARGILGITAAQDGLAVLQMADSRFWHQEMIEGELASFYYDSNPSHNGSRMEAYGNAPMLAALARAYGVTRKREHLDKATALLDSFDAHIWDRNRGGYGADLDSVEWKALSVNVAFLRAILDLYDVTARPALLNRARETLEFIERDLLIEDPEHPGFMICSHDWSPFYGPSEYCCTGCNFALLEGIFRLNELVQNGPTYPNRIRVCGTLPGGEHGWRDVAAYVLILAVPVLWIIRLKRREVGS